MVDLAAYADLVRRAQAIDQLQVLAAAFDRRMANSATPGGGARLRALAAAGIAPQRTTRKAKAAR